MAAPGGAIGVPRAAGIQQTSVRSLAELIQDPSKIDVPFEHVTVQEIHQGTNGKLIIHVQDAHANYSAQKHMAESLDYLMNRYEGLSLVLSEGGEGNASLGHIQDQLSLKDIQISSRRLLLEGILSGHEYLNLTSQPDMTLIGIEDRDLYDENLMAYAKLAESRQNTLQYLHRIQISLDRIKNRMYPKQILLYEEHEKENAAANTFVDTFAELEAMAQDLGMSLEQYPTLVQLSKIKAIEASINFIRVNSEQGELFKRMAHRGASKVVHNYLKHLKLFSNSHVSQYLLMQNVLRAAEPRGIYLDSFPALQKYMDYLAQFSKLKIEDLISESDLLKEAVYDQLLVETDHKVLRAIDRYVALLKKAYSIQMTSDEFSLFLVNEADFPDIPWQGFLNQKLAELGYFKDLIPYQSDLDDSKVSLRKFYNLVDQRDLAFMRNSQRILEKNEDKAAFLIAGGYHTAHLTELFRQQGYSYLVLSPTVSGPTDHTKYEEVLLAPLKRVVGGETGLKGTQSTLSRFLWSEPESDANFLNYLSKHDYPTDHQLITAIQGARSRKKKKRPQAKIVWFKPESAVGKSAGARADRLWMNNHDLRTAVRWAVGQFREEYRSKIKFGEWSDSKFEVKLERNLKMFLMDEIKNLLANAIEGREEATISLADVGDDQIQLSITSSGGIDFESLREKLREELADSPEDLGPDKTVLTYSSKLDAYRITQKKMVGKIVKSEVLVDADKVDDLTEDDLLYVEGLSTRDGSSEISGRGIGLTYVKRFADWHGLLLSYTTTEQETTFNLTFPRFDTDPTTVGARDSSDAPRDARNADEITQVALEAIQLRMSERDSILETYVSPDRRKVAVLTSGAAGNGWKSDKSLGEYGGHYTQPPIPQQVYVYNAAFDGHVLAIPSPFRDYLSIEDVSFDSDSSDYLVIQEKYSGVLHKYDIRAKDRVTYSNIVEFERVNNDYQFGIPFLMRVMVLISLFLGFYFGVGPIDPNKHLGFQIFSGILSLAVIVATDRLMKWLLPPIQPKTLVYDQTNDILDETPHRSVSGARGQLNLRSFFRSMTAIALILIGYHNIWQDPLLMTSIGMLSPLATLIMANVLAMQSFLMIILHTYVDRSGNRRISPIFAAIYAGGALSLLGVSQRSAVEAGEHLPQLQLIFSLLWPTNILSLLIHHQKIGTSIKPIFTQSRKTHEARDDISGARAVDQIRRIDDGIDALLYKFNEGIAYVEKIERGADAIHTTLVKSSDKLIDLSSGKYADLRFGLMEIIYELERLPSWAAQVDAELSNDLQDLLTLAQDLAYLIPQDDLNLVTLDSAERNARYFHWGAWGAFALGIAFLIWSAHDMRVGQPAGSFAKMLLAFVSTFAAHLFRSQREKAWNTEITVSSEGTSQNTGARAIQPRVRQPLDPRVRTNLARSIPVFRSAIMSGASIIDEWRSGKRKGVEAHMKDFPAGTPKRDLIVTIADPEVQNAILDVLEDVENGLPFRFRVIGEEEEGNLRDRIERINQRNRHSRYEVVIDPIDGTFKFVNQRSTFFGSIIYLMHNDDVIAGFFVAPERTVAGHKGALWEASELEEGVFISRIDKGIISDRRQLPAMDPDLDINGRGVTFDHGVEADLNVEGLRILENKSSGLEEALIVTPAKNHPIAMASKMIKVWDAGLMYFIEKAGGVAVDFQGQHLLPLNRESLVDREQGLSIPEFVAGHPKAVKHLISGARDTTHMTPSTPITMGDGDPHLNITTDEGAEDGIYITAEEVMSRLDTTDPSLIESQNVFSKAGRIPHGFWRNLNANAKLWYLAKLAMHPDAGTDNHELMRLRDRNFRSRVFTVDEGGQSRPLFGLWRYYRHQAEKQKKRQIKQHDVLEAMWSDLGLGDLYQRYFNSYEAWKMQFMASPIVPTVFWTEMPRNLKRKFYLEHIERLRTQKGIQTTPDEIFRTQIFTAVWPVDDGSEKSLSGLYLDYQQQLAQDLVDEGEALTRELALKQINNAQVLQTLKSDLGFEDKSYYRDGDVTRFHFGRQLYPSMAETQSMDQRRVEHVVALLRLKDSEFIRDSFSKAELVKHGQSLIDQKGRHAFQIGPFKNVHQSKSLRVILTRTLAYAVATGQIVRDTHSRSIDGEYYYYLPAQKNASPLTAAVRHQVGGVSDESGMGSRASLEMLVKAKEIMRKRGGPVRKASELAAGYISWYSDNLAFPDAQYKFGRKSQAAGVGGLNITWTRVTGKRPSVIGRFELRSHVERRGEEDIYVIEPGLELDIEHQRKGVARRIIGHLPSILPDNAELRIGSSNIATLMALARSLKDDQKEKLIKEIEVYEDLRAKLIPMIEGSEELPVISNHPALSSSYPPVNKRLFIRMELDELYDQWKPYRVKHQKDHSPDLVWWSKAQMVLMDELFQLAVSDGETVLPLWLNVHHATPLGKLIPPGWRDVQIWPNPDTELITFVYPATQGARANQSRVRQALDPRVLNNLVRSTPVFRSATISGARAGERAKLIRDKAKELETELYELVAYAEQKRLDSVAEGLESHLDMLQVLLRRSHADLREGLLAMTLEFTQLLTSLGGRDLELQQALEELPLLARDVINQIPEDQDTVEQLDRVTLKTRLYLWMSLGSWLVGLATLGVTAWISINVAQGQLPVVGTITGLLVGSGFALLGHEFYEQRKDALDAKITTAAKEASYNRVRDESRIGSRDTQELLAEVKQNLLQAGLDESNSNMFIEVLQEIPGYEAKIGQLNLANAQRVREIFDFHINHFGHDTLERFYIYGFAEIYVKQDVIAFHEVFMRLSKAIAHYPKIARFTTYIIEDLSTSSDVVTLTNRYLTLVERLGAWFEDLDDQISYVSRVGSFLTALVLRNDFDEVLNRLVESRDDIKRLVEVVHNSELLPAKLKHNTEELYLAETLRLAHHEDGRERIRAHSEAVRDVVDQGLELNYAIHLSFRASTRSDYANVLRGLRVHVVLLNKFSRRLRRDLAKREEQVLGILELVSVQPNIASAISKIETAIERLPQTRHTRSVTTKRYQTHKADLRKSIVTVRNPARDTKGSAFVVHRESADGLYRYVLLTNAHVARSAYKMMVDIDGDVPKVEGADVVFRFADSFRELPDLAVLVLVSSEDALKPLDITSQFEDGESATLFSGVYDKISTGDLVTFGNMAISLGIHETIVGDSGSPFLAAGEDEVIGIEAATGPIAWVFTPELNQQIVDAIHTDTSEPGKVWLNDEEPEELQFARESLVTVFGARAKAFDLSLRINTTTTSFMQVLDNLIERARVNNFQEVGDVLEDIRITLISNSPNSFGKLRTHLTKSIEDLKPLKSFVGERDRQFVEDLETLSDLGRELIGLISIDDAGRAVLDQISAQSGRLEKLAMRLRATGAMGLLMSAAAAFEGRVLPAVIMVVVSYLVLESSNGYEGAAAELKNQDVEWDDVFGPDSDQEGTDGARVSRTEIEAAIDEINSESKRPVFNDTVKSAISEKLETMHLVRGRSALVIGPGYSADYLPILLNKLGIRTSVIDEDDDHIEAQQRLHKKLGVDNDITSTSSYAQLAEGSFEYVFALGVLNEVVANHTRRAMMAGFRHRPWELEEDLKVVIQSSVGYMARFLTRDDGHLFVNFPSVFLQIEDQMVKTGLTQAGTLRLDELAEFMTDELATGFAYDGDVDISDFSLTQGYFDSDQTGFTSEPRHGFALKTTGARTSASREIDKNLTAAVRFPVQDRFLAEGVNLPEFIPTGSRGLMQRGRDFFMRIAKHVVPGRYALAYAGNVVVADISKEDGLGVVEVNARLVPTWSRQSIDDWQDLVTTDQRGSVKASRDQLVTGKRSQIKRHLRAVLDYLGSQVGSLKPGGLVILLDSLHVEGNPQSFEQNLQLLATSSRLIEAAGGRVRVQGSPKLIERLGEYNLSHLVEPLPSDLPTITVGSRNELLKSSDAITGGIYVMRPASTDEGTVARLDITLLVALGLTLFVNQAGMLDDDLVRLVARYTGTSTQLVREILQKLLAGEIDEELLKTAEEYVAIRHMLVPLYQYLEELKSILEESAIWA